MARFSGKIFAPVSQANLTIRRTAARASVAFYLLANIIAAPPPELVFFERDKILICLSRKKTVVCPIWCLWSDTRIVIFKNAN